LTVSTDPAKLLLREKKKRGARRGVGKNERCVCYGHDQRTGCGKKKANGKAVHDPDWLEKVGKKKDKCIVFREKE